METLINFIANCWQVVVDLAPWLFLGGAIAGVMHIFMPPDFIKRHLGRGSFRNVLKAVLLGIPMPLCSCGVIPAGIGLKKDGASDGAAVGFLISTPQTGIDSIFVSASFIGWPFAIFKVFAAFITGLVGGAVVNSNSPPTEEIEPAAYPQGSKIRNKSLREITVNFAKFVFGDLIYSIWKWLVIGIAVSAAITTFVPANSLAELPFVQGITGKFVILVFSMTLYVCATASVPIAASLIAAGMPVGSALVFLMAGPATNLATMGAVYRTFGKKVLLQYLLVISIGSILLGQLFDILFNIPAGSLIHGHDHTNIVSFIMGAAFLGLMGWYAWKDTFSLMKIRLSGKKDSESQKFEINVRGMTCQNCANRVKTALSANPAVNNVDIDLENGLVRVAGNGLERQNLSKTIRDKGYQVVEPDS